MLNQEELKKDINRAIENLRFSIAPISKFNVSAILTSKDGEKITGVNIESSSLMPGCCAERTAFFKAISEGILDFESIIVIGGKDGKITDYVTPCGVCRQLMRDYCNPDTFLITVAIDENNYKSYKLKDLLPYGFGFDDLDKE